MAVAFTATRALTACAPCVTRSICRGRTTPESPPWLLSVRTAKSTVNCQCVEPGAFNSFFLHFYCLSFCLSLLPQVAAVGPRRRLQPFRDWRPPSATLRPPPLPRSPTPSGERMARFVVFFFSPIFFNLFVGHGSAVEDNHSHLACWLQ